MSDNNVNNDLYRECASIQLTDVPVKCKADITAIQEMRWTGQGCSKRATCAIYNSCNLERRESGCGFMVSKRLSQLVSRYTPVNERAATIRPKGRLFNITLICAHALMEGKEGESKDAFYAETENTVDCCPIHDDEIVFGVLTQMSGKEVYLALLLDNSALSRPLRKTV